MHVLFIVLNEVDYLDEILSKFVDIGIRGATILDSQGMAGALAGSPNKDFPFFGSLKLLFEGARPFNKTIFSVIENEELLQKTVDTVREVLSEVDRPGIGFMFSLPIKDVYPIKRKEQS